MKSDGREIIAEVKGGKLQRFVSETVRGWLEDYGEGLIRIALEPYTPGRSNSQLAYYRAVVLPAARKMYMDAGCPLSVDQVHEVMLHKFAPSVTIDLPDGESLLKTKRTRASRGIGMDTEEMSNFIQGIVAMLAEYGHYVRGPNEQIHRTD